MPSCALQVSNRNLSFVRMFLYRPSVLGDHQPDRFAPGPPNPKSDHHSSGRNPHTPHSLPHALQRKSHVGACRGSRHRRCHRSSVLTSLEVEAPHPEGLLSRRVLTLSTPPPTCMISSFLLYCVTFFLSHLYVVTISLYFCIQEKQFAMPLTLMTVKYLSIV